MAQSVAPKLIGQVRLGNLPILGPFRVFRIRTLSQEPEFIPMRTRVDR